jgi:hypothetical protein
MTIARTMKLVYVDFFAPFILNIESSKCIIKHFFYLCLASVTHASNLAYKKNLVKG